MTPASASEDHPLKNLTYLMTISPMTAASLKPNEWLHGTAAHFEAWTFPPPSKDKYLESHSAVFLTKDLNFALGAGSNVCQSHVLQDAMVLAPLTNPDDGERLRKNLSRTALGRNCAWVAMRGSWHGSWRSGQIMKYAGEPSVLQNILSQLRREFETAHPTFKNDHPELPYEHSMQVCAKHNLTRRWIETLVKEARQLGFDALEANEVDNGIARPWLAALGPRALSKPIWR